MDLPLLPVALSCKQSGADQNTKISSPKYTNPHLMFSQNSQLQTQEIFLELGMHWKLFGVMMQNLSLLVSPAPVKMTTSVSTSDN